MKSLKRKKITFLIFFLNCQIDVEAPAYVRTARYAPVGIYGNVFFLLSAWIAGLSCHLLTPVIIAEHKYKIGYNVGKLQEVQVV